MAGAWTAYGDDLIVFGAAGAARIEWNGTEWVEAEILANSRGHLASYKLPKRILLVDVVRRAPNGKADYAWAKEYARTSLGLE